MALCCFGWFGWSFLGLPPPAQLPLIQQSETSDGALKVFGRLPELPPYSRLCVCLQTHVTFWCALLYVFHGKVSDRHLPPVLFQTVLHQAAPCFFLSLVASSCR